MSCRQIEETSNQFFENQKHQESNPGPLGEEQEHYPLCDAATLNPLLTVFEERKEKQRKLGVEQKKFGRRRCRPMGHFYSGCVAANRGTGTI